MKGKIMLEKRCKIAVKDADFVSITCKNCNTSCDIAIGNANKMKYCPVCRYEIKENLQKYIRTLAGTNFHLDDDFEIALVSVEKA